MATGLLVIGIGPATRLLTFAVGLDKTYRATIRLGAATPTDDADSEPDQFADPGVLSSLDPAAIERALIPLRGDIMQSPSAVSAIKVDGRRAYARVRAGEDVELAARPVTVSRFVTVSTVRHSSIEDESGDSHDVVDIDVEVDCSSGTYIRALARDLGGALGVHGHLTALRRTRVGGYSVEDALSVPDFDATAPAPALMAPATSASELLPVVSVSAQQAASLRHGQFVTADTAALPEGPEPFAAIVEGANGAPGDLVAIVDLREGEFAPRVVFPAGS